ncbi:Leucine rich repeat-containing protein [Pseudobutyrivibrio sp. YE44]|uniref:leucine-rich repeat protein n=1 Tax=Pseudobutyrivibrio sp. YE44 TaxID=1520802 RepID=UPI00089071FC|nr:leucine-rich repeat protein [Pseudobutyrivibrio sp. YE44]SDB56882.1 Leucine rich repeat-containing protein [Pseudobutyrivibrio sp. YE44]
MKPNKKYILLIIAVVFICFFIIVKNDREVWIGDYKYDIFLNNFKLSVYVVEYKGGEEIVKIPSNIGPFKVDYVKDGVYEGNNKIKKVVIGKESAENVSFRECENLEKVVYEDGVKICKNDFSHCVRLTKIEMNESMEEVDLRLRKCINLKKILIPNRVKTISLECRDCESLESLKFPEDIEKIDYLNIEKCTALLDLLFPSTLQEIDLFICEGTPFVEQHKDDKYYIVGDGCLIISNGANGIVPLGVKNSSNLVKQSDNMVYYPDSLKIFDYSDVDYNTHCFGAEEFEKINIDSKCTIVAPEGSPMAKYCQENGLNYRPSTPEEEATRKQKTEAAASEITYQDNN